MSGPVPIALLCCLVAIPAADAAERWGIPGAQQRYVLERDAETPDGDVGRVVVWPQGQDTPEAVVTRDGQPVATTTLDDRPGEPLRLLFDSSAAGTYHVVLGEDLPEREAWEPRIGLVLETRAPGGGDLGKVEGLLRAWADAGERHGRDLVGQVFHGFNIFGPNSRYTSRYDGWFRVEEAGTYLFGTVSDDASALWIDGELVASWTGGHGMTDRGGHRFKHHGEIRLVPGLHRLEYLHVQAGGGSGTLAAWLPPGAEKPSVIPEEVFVPVARYRVRKLEGGPGLRWRMLGHTAFERHLVVDTEVRAVELREGDRVIWTADDGSSGSGSTWRHTWAVPGLRTVKVRVERGDTTVLEREQAIAVGWTPYQRDAMPDELWAEQLERLKAVDLATVADVDLAELITLMERLDDEAWRRALVDGLLASGREPGELSAPLILELAIAIQEPGSQRYEAAVRLFDWLHRSASAPPAIRAAAGLHQAGLQIQILGDVDTGRELLAAIDREALTSGEKRLAAIYHGDVALYAGKSEEALRRYRQVGSTAHAGDIGYAMKRRVRLETARDYIRREAADAAEAILRDIEWETPEERMGGEMVELQSEVWLLRGEWRFALARLPVVIAARSEDPRLPELLLLLVRARLDAGERAGAEQAADRLRREHPFSEAAARLPKHIDPASLELRP